MRMTSSTTVRNVTSAKVMMARHIFEVRLRHWKAEKSGFVQSMPGPAGHIVGSDRPPSWARNEKD